jgi:hypothetical protein
LTMDDTVEDGQITVHIRYSGLTDYIKDVCPHMMMWVPERDVEALRMTFIPLKTEIGMFLRKIK